MSVRTEISLRFYGYAKTLDGIIQRKMEVVMRSFPGRFLGLLRQ